MRGSTMTLRSVVLTAVALTLPFGVAAGKAEAAAKKARKASGARRKALALRPVPLPDGSGVVRLPSGWKITSAHQGMVSAAGPHGTVDLGIWCQVYTPEEAAQWWAKPPIIAPYGDTVVSLRKVMTQFMRLSGVSGWRWVRLIDRAPAAAPQGKGEFIHYEWSATGKGKFQSVALVMMMPNVDGSWTFYSSTITSPSASFARNLPALQQIWASWKVDDRVHQKRLANALESMKETGRILQGMNRTRSEAQDRSSRASSHVIRGTWVIEDTETGKRYEVAHDDMRQRLERMNRAEGYERYREVPYRRLNR